MVKRQIRPWDVTSDTVLDALYSTPREDFIPKDYQSLAFSETNIPIGHNQYMLTPVAEGKLLQSLNLKGSEKVLLIGTGSGYSCAILSKLVKHITAVDYYEDFTEQAKLKFKQHNITNVSCETGDASQGWENGAPFDLILITGSLPALPANFKKHLTQKGKIVAILGEDKNMHATAVSRDAEGLWTSTQLFEMEASQLINALQPERFVF